MIVITYLFIMIIIYIFYINWEYCNRFSYLVMSDNNKNKMKLLCMSLKIILQILYLSCLQKMNKTIIKVGKDKYELSYVIDGKLYKLYVFNKRGPSPVLQIINDSNEDITNIISPYIGPSYDWHNSKLTPSFFGYEHLTFELSNGNNFTTNKDDILEKFV